MKYIDAEKLKAEIEKRKNICNGVYERDSDTYYQGKAVAYQETLSIIDSLQQEQPCDTCTNDKACVTCKDGELWEGKPVEDLEKEIKTWIPAHIVGGDEVPWKELKDVVIQWAGIVARHFYILGLKNNIPVTQITLAELAKEGELVSKDLEEAADKYSNENEYMDVGFCVEPVYIGHKTEKAFIAGAEWQKGQMLKDAVEGEVCKDHIVTEKPFYFYQSRLIELPDNLKEGDKVKIVIVKEDKK